MRTSSKIFLDTHVVGFAVRLLNLLVIPLGKVLRLDHSLSRPFRTIAVCKYKGMGSIIQATPLINTLRAQYPEARIVFVTSAENVQILKHIPGIDEVVSVNDRSFSTLILSILPFLRRLIGLRIDVYMDLEVYSNFSTLVSVLSMARNRMGFYLNSKHYRLGNYTHMMYYNTRSAISDTYLQFARMLNCAEVKPKLTLLDTGIRTLEYGGERIDLPSARYIVVNPNASDLRIERRWPAGKYRELIRWLMTEYPAYRIMLVGSGAEKAYVQEVLEPLQAPPEQVLSLAGSTRIPELIAVIKHASLFITNDSGPMHISFATQTPVIALFGPCSPSQYGVNEHCYPIYENLYCSPCVHEFVQPPCGGNNLCMKMIAEDKVKLYVKRILETRENPVSTPAEILFKVGPVTVGRLDRAQSQTLGTAEL